MVQQFTKEISSSSGEMVIDRSRRLKLSKLIALQGIYFKGTQKLFN